MLPFKMFLENENTDPKRDQKLLLRRFKAAINRALKKYDLQMGWSESTKNSDGGFTLYYGKSYLHWGRWYYIKKHDLDKKWKNERDYDGTDMFDKSKSRYD